MGEIHTVQPAIGPSSHKVAVKLNTPVGVLAQVQDHHEILLVGAKDTIGLLNKSSGTFKSIKELYEKDEKQSGRLRSHRLNDGACDRQASFVTIDGPITPPSIPVVLTHCTIPQGRFFVGSMYDPALGKSPESDSRGILFCLHPDLGLDRIFQSVGIPNGISWTRDEKTMYWTETIENSVYAFDYDVSTGQMTNKRVFFQTSGDEIPDGHAMDVEEHLWIAIFNGSKVLRVSPRGEVVAKITLPTRAVTCPAFVGEDLYITTGMDPQGSKLADYQGDVFKCHAGVSGRSKNPFKLNASALITANGILTI